MKLIEKQIKQIILEETKKYFQEVELARQLSNVGRMSLDVFKKFVQTLSQEINLGEDPYDAYLQISLDMKKNWHPQTWEDLRKEDQRLFLKTTYPGTPYDKSYSMMIDSFTSSVAKNIIVRDVNLVVQKVEDLKKEPEYLGPEKKGELPKSPHWKAFLEEIVKEEIIKVLKENE